MQPSPMQAAHASEDDGKTGTIVWICICTLISNSAYALIAPFLPIELEHKGVVGGWVGLIFGVYSISVVLASVALGNFIHQVGSANLIALGIFFMGSTFVLMGFIDDCHSEIIIIAYAVLLRLVQGASSAFVQVTCYSIATNDFPEQKEMLVGLVEAMTGVGLLLGPILGSVLYEMLAMKYTFLVYGSFLMFLSIIVKLNF